MGFGLTTRALDLLNRTDIGDRGWGTRDEVGFLYALGTHRPRDFRRPVLTRHQLLGRYLEAARVRANWGEMDRDIVLEAARKLLKATEDAHA
jgi:hypothetical protein